MKQEDINLLKENGWLVVCESPFELENAEDSSSTASGLAAKLILETLKSSQDDEDETYLPEAQIKLSELCDICHSPLKLNIVRENNGCINPRCENYYHRRQ